MRNKLRKAVYVIFQNFRVIFYRFISTKAESGGRLLRRQPVIITGKGRIIVDGVSTIGFFPSPKYFSSYSHIEARNEDAFIKISSGTHINNDFCAIANHSSITIGRNCRIGYSVEIIDSNFHGISARERSLDRPAWSKPVSIGDNVFIGSNTKILKGVSIGSSSVIAAGSVVSRDVPANVIAGGNPCQVISSIDNE